MGFMSPAPMEIVVILVIALLVLGPARLPEAARSLGRGFRELRESLQADPHDEEDDAPPPAEAADRKRSAPAAGDSPYAQASPPSPGYAQSGPYDDDLPATEEVAEAEPPAAREP